jgi:hypothetical protein
LGDRCGSAPTQIVLKAAHVLHLSKKILLALQVLLPLKILLPLQILLALNVLLALELDLPLIIEATFDQSRTQASLQWRLTPWVTLEAGYLVQVPRGLILSHNLITSVTFRLPTWNPFEARDEHDDLPLPQG